MRNHLHTLTPLIILMVSICVDFYTFLGVRKLTSEIKSPRTRRFIHWTYWILCIAALLEVLSSLLLLRVFGDQYLFFFSVSFSVYICFSSMKFVLLLFLLGNDIYRPIARLFHSRFPKRSGKVTWIGLAFSVLSLFICMFGVTYGKYFYKVRHETLYFEHLPPAFDGFKIVAIADVHAGSFKRAKPVQRGIDLINKQQGDVIVFAGDLVNSRSEEFAPWIKYFKQLHAPCGQYSILGNHDYGDYARWPGEKEKEDNLELLKKYHAETGFRLLLNEHVTLEKDGQHIVLLGVENWGKGFGYKGDLGKAMEGVDTSDFKILLTHDPSHWEEQVKNNPADIQLSISGHTHGMQLGIEIPGFVKWSPAQYMYPHWAGLTEENGRYLYVTRGFGFLGLPGRIGIRPEITVIELRRK